MPVSMEPPVKSGVDNQQQGISRHLALGRILHFEALMRRRMGEVRAQRYVRLYQYYSGQNLPPDNVDQPLGINHFARICDKHNSYLWGQYKKHVVEFRARLINQDDVDDGQKEEAATIARKIKRLLDRVIFQDNKGDVTLDQGGLNGSIYGDTVFEVGYNEEERRVQIDAVLPEYFHCMWDITNMQKLQEVIVAYPIDRVVALETWGSNGNDQFLGYQAINPHYLPGIGVLWKRWSTTSFQIWIDDVCVLNGPNPYMPEDSQGNLFPGLIPFIHIPNMQGGADYWGYGDAECVMLLQDELNRRMADMGDLVNIHSHPIVTLKGFNGAQEDLSVGADAIWDLGREGEAKRLEGTGPGPDTMAYLDKVKLEIQETSSMPAVAYGSHQGSMGHTAGIALAMSMMPVTERAKKKRLRWREELKRLCQMIFWILKVRDPDFLKSYGLTYEQIQLFEIEPVFADVLPKDELQVVNENVATVANGIRSKEKALEKMGEEDIPAEIARIQQDQQFSSQLGAAVPQPGAGGKNNDQGQGGSNMLPGGIGAKDGKPGILIKSGEVDQPDNVSLDQTT